jgi:hypothetical protein
MRRKTGALYLPETATCTLHLNGREAVISSFSKRKPSPRAAGKVYLHYKASVAVFTAKMGV